MSTDKVKPSVILKPTFLKKLELEYIEKNKLHIIKTLEEAWSESISKNRISSEEGCVLIIPKEKLKLFTKQFIQNYFHDKGWKAEFNFNVDNSNPNIYIKLISEEITDSPLSDGSETSL